MAHRGQLLAVVAVTLGAAACGPKLPRIDTACGQPAAGGALDQQHLAVRSPSSRLGEDAVALIGGTCTGTLIAAANGPVDLTAGHCGSVMGTGRESPS